LSSILKLNTMYFVIFSKFIFWKCVWCFSNGTR
jgi:hypothetical protein